MTDSERLIAIAKRQETMIVAINRLADSVETHTEMLSTFGAVQEEIKEWLQAPPSNDLPDLLKRLTTAIETMQQHILRLPEMVVRAVVDGELSSRA